MRFFGALLGGLVWIVAGVVGLLGIVLSVTVILLPLGIPLLMLARRLFGVAATLALPRKVRHPAQEMKKSMRKKGDDVASAAPDLDLGKAATKARKKTRKLVSRQRKRIA